MMPAIMGCGVTASPFSLRRSPNNILSIRRISTAGLPFVRLHKKPEVPTNLKKSLFPMRQIMNMQDNTTKLEPDFLTALELAVKLNVSLKSIINWTQAHRLPIIKMGRINRYPRIEIEKRLLSGSLLLDKKVSK
jgi:hypothetical protein